MARLMLASLPALLLLASAQEAPPLLPPSPYVASYDMAASSIVMICNFSGYQTTSSTKGWSVIDFDWSNSLQEWSAATPMDTNERLLVQAAMTQQAQPNSSVWIYRNSVYG